MSVYIGHESFSGPFRAPSLVEDRSGLYAVLADPSGREILELDEAALSQSRYFYAEGYMSSADGSREAAITGREMAERAGVKTALSLSDPSMGEVCRDALVEILGNGVDHLFCNEEEALAWPRRGSRGKIRPSTSP